MKFTNYHKNAVQSSTSHSCSVVSATTRHRHIVASRSRAVWAGRIAFLTFLLCLACVVGWVTYTLLSQSERALARLQFRSAASRALKEAQGISNKKRLGTLSMAALSAQMQPDANLWPFVTIPGYETLATHLIATSAGREMGFCPLVTPEQLSDFETFAYQYYEQDRNPPFPNGTAMSSFGKGVWGKNPNLDNTDKRYHETGLSTNYGSPNAILAPILHHNAGAFPALLLNLHFQKDRGIAIDSVLACSEQRALTQNPQEHTCGVLTDILMLTSQKEGTGPGALIFQPIYPVHNQTQLTGLIASSIVWEEVLEDVFEDRVSGIDCVLQTDNQVHTYTITDGVAHWTGDGVDLHQSKYNDLRQTIDLASDQDYSPDSTTYTLSVYPNDDWMNVYSTRNPRAATTGAVLVMLVTSLLFVLYDCLVRREFHHKKQLLEARRMFVRFVSHEVRTPLNSVCMGLSLMQGEMSSALGYKSVEEMEQQQQQQEEKSADEEPEQEKLVDKEYQDPSSSSLTATKDAAKSATTTGSSLSRFTSDWFSLSSEILANTDSAINVLNDLLNYDKIETGSLRLEKTIISIWNLIETTANEFKLPAQKKQIQFELSFDNHHHGTTSTSEEDPEAADVKGGKTPATTARALSAEMLARKVVGDEVRMKQVIRNLISNAIKFTPQQGKIVLHAVWQNDTNDSKEPTDSFTLKNGESVTVPPSGVLELSVKDSGVGLSQAQVSKLFSDGVQFNVNELQAGNGSGLGLYISKGIAEQHSGTLQASSRGLGHGTTFTLGVPLYNIPSENDTQMTDSISMGFPMRGDSTDSISQRILVVDDSLSNRKLLCRLLRHHGHTCDEAENGKVAVQKALEATVKEEPYDTVLMDYEMPILNGPLAAKQIRARGCDVFIVGITGNMLPDDVAYFRSCGANAVLPKPFKMSALDDVWTEYGNNKTHSSSNKMEPSKLFIFEGSMP